MKSMRFLVLTAAAFVAVSATGANADGAVKCAEAAKETWQPISAAEAATSAAGYEVRKSKTTDGGCFEVYGVKDGQLYELFFNPGDLKLVATVTK